MDAFKHIVITGDWRVFKHIVITGDTRVTTWVLAFLLRSAMCFMGPWCWSPTLLCNIAIKIRYKKLKDILSAVVKKGKLCVHLFYKFDSAFMSYWMVNASYRFGTWIIFFSLLYFMKMYFWVKKDHLFNSFISLL